MFRTDAQVAMNVVAYVNATTIDRLRAGEKDKGWVRNREFAEWAKDSNNNNKKCTINTRSRILSGETDWFMENDGAKIRLACSTGYPKLILKFLMLTSFFWTIEVRCTSKCFLQLLWTFEFTHRLSAFFSKKEITSK